jgi:hypothetical protein
VHAKLCNRCPTTSTVNGIPQMNDTLHRFKDVFNRLNANNLELLQEIYRPDVRFEDPVHRLEGLPALSDYYRRLYQGVSSCRFDFEDEIVQGDRAALVWIMSFEHARFKRGETLELSGVSHLKFDQRVFYHRDYFDMGAFIYERVPLLSSVIRTIKRRL